MDTTSQTLLDRLRRPAQQDAWARFVKLYTPLLYQWARGLQLPSEETADLVQDVLTLLVRKLPEFTYDRHKSFRAWLRTIVVNRWRENQRRRSVYLKQAAPGALSDVAAPEESAPFEEEEYRNYLVGRALRLMQAEFRPETWKACWETVAGDRPAANVARELGITVNAVYLAKSRVLRRLHQELSGLLD